MVHSLRGKRTLRVGAGQLPAVHLATEERNRFLRLAREPRMRGFVLLLANWERMHKVLAEGWETREGRAPSLVFGAVGVALDFQSWRTMVRKQGMTDEQAVELMAG